MSDGRELGYGWPARRLAEAEERARTEASRTRVVSARRDRAYQNPCRRVRYVEQLIDSVVHVHHLHRSLNYRSLAGMPIERPPIHPPIHREFFFFFLNNGSTAHAGEGRGAR
jgi:hypothetical protein